MATFSQHYDETIRDLETRLSNAIDGGTEFDFEKNGDVLTLEFDDGERFIISPNSPVQQLWVSANFSGSRFNWSDEANEWIHEKDGRALTHFLDEELSKKLGKAVSI
jgi:iron-sulfur cluster assembly protein CyaY